MDWKWCGSVGRLISVTYPPSVWRIVTNTSLARAACRSRFVPGTPSNTEQEWYLLATVGYVDLDG
jgi:hypothetical protein